MTVSDWLQQSQQKLEKAGVGTARLDSLILLEDCLNKNRTHLLAYPELEITSEQEMYLWEQVERRTCHEPLAYIRGKAEFYGREFIVDKNVLVPRPESETIIDLLKEATLPSRPYIADIGTGSGALGITAKLELPNAQVDLFDISEPALHVAKKNVNKFSVPIGCSPSDILASVPTFYDVVIANLPYVPDTFNINHAAEHEPSIALFGGTDGLGLYRRLFTQIRKPDRRPALILVESLPQQHIELMLIAQVAGFGLAKTDDFIQQFEQL